MGTPPTRVGVLGELPAGYLERIAGAWPDAHVVVGDAALELPNAAVLVWDAALEELLRAVRARPAPRWLHTRWAGIDPRLVEAVRGRDLVLTNGTGTHGAAVAEHVLALLLAHYRRLPDLLSGQRRRCWPDRFPMAELRGKVVGIIGLGDLGTSIARLLRPFGARVLGLRRRAGHVPEVDQVFRPDRLHDFLGRLDALVLAAPLTPETHGMIGATELALLPAGAFLVNVGRGPLVDETALVAALRSGWLGGAALDVFAVEPLPASSGLWSLPNVLISPHCADHTAETDERCLLQMLENAARFREGRPLLNWVDLDRGY